jgi:small-conductance mechanosensitive channel
MATALMDLYTLSGIASIGLGILLAEEVLSLVVRRAAKSAGAGPTVVRDIRATLRALAAVLIVSNILSYSGLSSLFTGLTVSAIVAVAVSLALQTTLSNVISGLLLFSDGVLRFGDTIEYGGTKGEVVRIGLRNTWVKTEEGHLTVISNSSLSGGPLVNHTATDRLTRKYAFGKA